MDSPNSLLGHSAGELAARIARRECSAREVVAAHIARLEQLQAECRPLASERFEAALRDAEAADAHQQAGRPCGPLHGIPMTIKEAFAFPGLPTTLGLTDRIGTCDAQLDPLVERLMQAGAIIVGKSNVPQLMYYHETENPVTGRTCNPWQRDRTAGGSSGGEAAAIAGLGVPLGLGSDLGGSIRIPCHFCGITGLKPTAGRVATEHLSSNFRGLEALTMQPGPMARRVIDLETTLGILIGGQDPHGSVTCPPVPWRVSELPQLAGLRVGICEDDRFFSPAPAIQRTVRLAGHALAQQGVTLVPFEVPRVHDAMRLYFQLIAADGGADLRRLTRKSRHTPQISRILLVNRLPRSIRTIATMIMASVGQRRWSELLDWTHPLSGDQLWQATHARNQYRQTFWQYWSQLRLDGLVCPVHALPAFRHGQSTDLLSAASYCLWPMLLGMPAGTVPITRVQPEEEQLPQRDRRDAIESAAMRAEHESRGLPVGVQVLARPWQDNLVLRIMRAIEQQMEFT